MVEGAAVDEALGRNLGKVLRSEEGWCKIDHVLKKLDDKFLRPRGDYKEDEIRQVVAHSRKGRCATVFEISADDKSIRVASSHNSGVNGPDVCWQQEQAPAPQQAPQQRWRSTAEGGAAQPPQRPTQTSSSFAWVTAPCDFDGRDYNAGDIYLYIKKGDRLCHRYNEQETEDWCYAELLDPPAIRRNTGNSHGWVPSGYLQSLRQPDASSVSTAAPSDSSGGSSHRRHCSPNTGDTGGTSNAGPRLPPAAATAPEVKQVPAWQQPMHPAAWPTPPSPQQWQQHRQPERPWEEPPQQRQQPPLQQQRPQQWQQQPPPPQQQQRPQQWQQQQPPPQQQRPLQPGPSKASRVCKAPFDWPGAFEDHEYTAEYLRVQKGEELQLCSHTEEDAGWAFVKVVRTDRPGYLEDRQGWVPGYFFDEGLSESPVAAPTAAEAAAPRPEQPEDPLYKADPWKQPASTQQPWFPGNARPRTRRDADDKDHQQPHAWFVGAHQQRSRAPEPPKAPDPWQHHDPWGGGTATNLTSARR